MPQIKKLADGKFLIRVSRGTGKNRVWVNKTFTGTAAEARTFARKQESILDSGYRPETDLKFEVYFEIWIKAIKSMVAPRTLDGYESKIRLYALRFLGHRRIGDIRPLHIQAIYNKLDHLSPTTVRNLHASLRTCFSYAVRKEYLKSNPCRNVDLPKRKRHEIAVLNENEIGSFVDVCRKMKNGIIFAFALQTGMRPEEYLALRWKDLNDHEIIVQQAVQFNRKGGGYYFKELKTSSSRRRIPISASMRQWLTTHRREQNEHRLAMKGTWFNYDLIFANEIGRPFAINNLTRRYFSPILEKCDLGKHITLYSLRHTCASLLFMCGENAKTVAERLGHANVNLTLQTYTHVLPGMQEAATDKLDRLMKMA